MQKAMWKDASMGGNNRGNRHERKNLAAKCCKVSKTLNKVLIS